MWRAFVVGFVAVLMASQCEAAVKMPQDVTWSSAKHRADEPTISSNKGEAGGGVQGTNQQKHTTSPEAESANSLWYSNQSPPKGEPVGDLTTSQGASKLPRERSSSKVLSTDTQCALLNDRVLITHAGCKTKYVRTTKCYGMCASYVVPVAPQSRKTKGHLFDHKCECCQSTGSRSTEVRLLCSGLKQARKKVTITRPTGCKCSTCG
ncbi:gremlin-1-like [Corticium candelabrum]|uniref:gremlin-1-like n=1 Tax=Corticium candelabrum TaxID=121492 RepID=UPI002E25355A|nr:gremlin-1-like [Corticium candelabrum]